MGSWHFPNRCGAEIDISVSKLLGFETFANFLRVSVSKNLVSEKSLGFGFRKFVIGKKVSVSVSENLVSEKKTRYRFRKIWYWKKSLGIGFGKFGIGKKVSVSVSVKFLVSSFSGAKGGIYGIPWDHQVGLMSLQMIHEAYKPVYISCIYKP